MSARTSIGRTAQWLLLIGLLWLGVTIDASAEDEYRPMPDSVRTKFTKADRNTDKKLSLEEFQATVAKEQAAVAKRDFQLFDHNADGLLTIEEFWSIPTVVAADQRGPVPDPIEGMVNQFIAVMDQFFKNWDQDPDRRIGRNEFLAEFTTTIQEPLTSNLQREADPDGDQMITRAEARRFVEIQFGARRSDGKLLRESTGRVAQHASFQHADLDRDDRLSRTEFMTRAYAGEKSEELFVNGDTNKDEFISWDEWCKMPGRMFDTVNEFRRLDKNLDGQVDPEELQAGTSEWIKISAVTAFPGFDTDRNGKLSLAEFRMTLQANPVLKWNEIILDPDGDGRLSRKEFIFDRSVPLLRFVYFRLLDVNGDGELDPKEYVFKLRLPREFYSLNADGTGWKKMFGVEGFPSIGSPVVSPDGKSIAFDGHRAKETTSKQMMLMIGIDGSNLRELGLGMMPNWSNDGRELACSRNQPQSGLWVLSADGKQERFLRNGWGAQFSPDGKQIAFSDYRVIMIYELATQKTTQVFDGVGNGFQQIYWNMSWSRDGKRLCFKGLKPNAVEEVATIWVDANAPRLKVHHSGKGITAGFAWHPSGEQIVYCMTSPERKVSQLYEFNPNTDDPPKLFKGQDETANISGHCWTPDGKQLIVITGNY